jgi:hypothetical protein
VIRERVRGWLGLAMVRLGVRLLGPQAAPDGEESLDPKGFDYPYPSRPLENKGVRDGGGALENVDKPVYLRGHGPPQAIALTPAARDLLHRGGPPAQRPEPEDDEPLAGSAEAIRRGDRAG